MSELLEVRDVSFAYNESAVILKDVSVTLREGEIVCLLGVSGGGKTTLFNIIAGLVRPDKGSVLLRGEDITGQSGKVSYMLQKDMLLPYRTVEDNVALPLIIKGTKKKEARRIVGGYFRQFGIDGRQKKYPAELSGGMRQRAALLRTYLFSADVALLDEPFSALDAITKADMHRWYLDVMENIRLSTIFITHDIDEAIMLSDRIYLLGGRPGEIKDEIVISEPKPRRADFNLTDDFLVYKRRIITQIQGNKI
jgi:ABC-type nitrate/sulfonate/bicarbonate transport system ATPase subunit